MQQSALVGMGQAVGETSPEPADGADVALAGEQRQNRIGLTFGSRRGIAFRRSAGMLGVLAGGLGKVLESLDEFASGGRKVFQRPVALQQIGHRRRAEIRHADTLQQPRAMHRIDRYDIRVLELRQGPRFAEEIGRHFECDRSPGQLGLGGEENASESAPPEFVNQLESEDFPARFGEELERGFEPVAPAVVVRKTLPSGLVHSFDGIHPGPILMRLAIQDLMGDFLGCGDCQHEWTRNDPTASTAGSDWRGVAQHLQTNTSFPSATGPMGSTSHRRFPRFLSTGTPIQNGREIMRHSLKKDVRYRSRSYPLSGPEISGTILTNCPAFGNFRVHIHA